MYADFSVHKEIKLTNHEQFFPDHHRSLWRKKAWWWVHFHHRNIYCDLYVVKTMWLNNFK
jgi:hypothetical protein